MRRTLGCSLVLVVALAAPSFAVLPSVPGHDVAEYAQVVDPVQFAFGASGEIFAGRDNSGSGGVNTDAVKVHRIAPGGSPVSEYGASAIGDPDIMFYDATGSISGVAGSIITGGIQSSTTGGLFVVRPDESIFTLAGPSTSYRNPTDLALDSFGNLRFTDNTLGGVWRILAGGGAPTLFFSPGAGVRDVELASDGRLYVSNATTKVIRIYNADGTLFNSSFAAGIDGSGIAVGPGGVWGTDLYAMEGSNLLRISPAGVQTIVGTGFGFIYDIRFGPDQALYASEFQADRILRIAPGVTASAEPSPDATAGAPRCFPNPFGARLDIDFVLPAGDRAATVVIADATGRVVHTARVSVNAAGHGSVRWNGRAVGGGEVPDGVYFADIASATTRQRTTMRRVR